MSIKMAMVSAAAGATLLGGVGAVALMGGGGTPPATAAVLTAATSPVGATSPAAAPSPGAAPGTGVCSPLKDDGGWPAEVEGRPVGFDANDPGGVYLWHDATGWHLRVTHRGDERQVYSGSLVTSGTFSDVDAVRLEHDDSFTVGPDGHVLTFRFVNYGGVDGLDFRTHCAEGIGFDLRGDGRSLPASDVYVGHDGDHPASDPFTIRRTEV
jgi:hypothetical protein